MDTEKAGAINIAVDEHLSKNSTDHVSLANSVVPLTLQERVPENKDSLKKESKDGECHIFSYQEFEQYLKKKPRMGSVKDVMRLRHDFMQLNLDVRLYENLSAIQTFKVLNEVSRKDHSKNKYFICCVLTHGNRDILWAKDGSMNINDILKIFSKSPSLKRIPKIFIFQACRGNEAELAVSTDSTDSGSSSDTENYLDFLIINSTYLDTLSFKTSDENSEKAHGSFFIDEFCRTLEQFSGNKDLLQILTIVNFRMAAIFLSQCEGIENLHRKKQMSCFTSGLRRKVMFNRNIEIFASRDTQYFDARRKRLGFGHDSTCDSLSGTYNIKMAKRVLFLSIINKSIGDNGSSVRKAINLQSDFANRKYSNKEFSNCFKKSKILEFLNENNKQSNSSEVECLICYVAAYSRYDSICDVRGKSISKEEIVDKFIAKGNKSFVGKPKIFVFLLCKSAENDKFLEDNFNKKVEPLEFGTNTNSSIRRFSVETDSVDGEINQNINSIDRGTNTESTDDRCIGENLIPIHADILQICLTFTDWEHAIEPMNSFREILQKSPSEDFLSVLTEFNHELVEKHNFYQRSKESSFLITSTLTKTLFLP